MPSIAQMPSSTLDPSSSNMKKRKREQHVLNESDGSMKLGNTQILGHAHASSLQTPNALFDIDISNYSPTEHLSLKTRLLKTPRSHHEAKRQRILGVFAVDEIPSPDNENTTLLLPHHENKSNAGMQRQNNLTTLGSGYTKTDLSACHICHQKPKVRSDLDSYADCELCGQRTCFICMRQCLGPPQLNGLADADEDTRMAVSLQMLIDDDLGEREEAERRASESGLYTTCPRFDYHRGMVCSRCCIEKGADGEVRCLGCLKAEEVG